MALNLNYGFISDINVVSQANGTVSKCPQSKIDPPLAPNHPCRRLWLIDYQATYNSQIASSIANFYSELSSQMANGDFSNMQKLAEIDGYLNSLSLAIGNHRLFLANIKEERNKKNRCCAKKDDLGNYINLDDAFKEQVDDAIVANEGILSSAELSMDIFYNQGEASLEYEEAIAETNNAIAQANSSIAQSDFTIADLNIKLGTKRLVQIALVGIALFYAYKLFRK